MYSFAFLKLILALCVNVCYYNIVLDIKYILLPKKVRFFKMKLAKLQQRIIKNMKEVEERNNSFMPLNDIPPLKNITIAEAIEREELYLDSLDTKESEMYDE